MRPVSRGAPSSHVIEYQPRIDIRSNIVSDAANKLDKSFLRPFADDLASIDVDGAIDKIEALFGPRN